MNNRIILFILIIILFTVIRISHAQESTQERCKQYYPRIVRESNYFMGVFSICQGEIYNTECFMNQIRTESNCKAWVTAFDGGMGLGQFMPVTAEELHSRSKSLQEFDFNPYDPNWNIRAMIIYGKSLLKDTLCKNDWYYAFRAYNGGSGNLNREIKKAYSCDHISVEKVCKRKVLTLKSGELLDLCRVNIDYTKRIIKHYK
jgi:hypothetical protein